MKYKLRRGLILIAAVPLLALAPSMAYASESSSCRADNADTCTTGTVAANPKTHTVSMTVNVFKGTAQGTCVVWDANTWVEVGRIQTGSTVGVVKKISGLYGTYVMGCYLPSDKGTVVGSLTNYAA